jgi:hypothetical protein
MPNLPLAGDRYFLLAAGTGYQKYRLPAIFIYGLNSQILMRFKGIPVCCIVLWSGQESLLWVDFRHCG